MGTHVQEEAAETVRDGHLDCSVTCMPHCITTMGTCVQEEATEPGRGGHLDDSDHALSFPVLCSVANSVSCKSKSEQGIREK